MVDLVRITALVAPAVEVLGFDLVRVAMFAHSEVGDELTLQIMAEDPATGQLVLDQCAALSRRISDAIDAAEESGTMLIEEAYRLEVSSPGIDRPLTRRQDFVQWAGHEAKLQLATPIEGNRKSLQGDLAGLTTDEDGDKVLIDDRKSGRVCVLIDDVISARLVLTDRLIAATRPLDISGADEIEGDDFEDAETENEMEDPAPGQAALLEQED